MAARAAVAEVAAVMAAVMEVEEAAVAARWVTEGVTVEREGAGVLVAAEAKARVATVWAVTVRVAEGSRVAAEMVRVGLAPVGMARAAVETQVAVEMAQVAVVLVGMAMGAPLPGNQVATAMGVVERARVAGG
jgi:hypothetical protein